MGGEKTKCLLGNTLLKSTSPAILELVKVLDAHLADEEAREVAGLVDLEQGLLDRVDDGFVRGEGEHERVHIALLLFEGLLVLGLWKGRLGGKDFAGDLGDVLHDGG
jgi:hypothetical protein